jgi:acyl-CoA reductase-like NAD-dependent aldehyde dehydrogenase
MALETSDHVGDDAGTSGSEEIVVTCPADGRVVGRVPDMTAEQVRVRAEELRAAQSEWQAIGFAGRRKWLSRYRDWFLDNEDRLHRMVQEETGKSWGDLSMGEVAVAVEVLNFYMANAEKYLAPVHERPHSLATASKKLMVEYSPFELVGVITPWNAQIANAMLDIPAALMAGCAVLSKPSEITPLTWAEAVRGWREDVGAPNVLGCVTGRGATGAAIVDNVDMIQFTGSTRTGRKIAARAAERLIYASLELGGKDATIVCADADLDRAAGAVVWGAFYNSGQICLSVERVYVEAAIYDEFLARVVEKAKSIRVGTDAPGGFDTDYGAMATETQLEIVERHVQDAREKDAKILTGGSRTGDGLFYAPTVITDVDHTMACMREETFGPTLPIMKVEGIDEAIALANDSDYGLAGSVWTSDPEKGMAIARRMRTGSVNINNAMTNVFQLPVPMGGWNASGLGSRHGAAGIRKYCRSKTIIAERVTLKSELYWYPTSRRRSRLMSRASRMLGAKDWRRRLGRKPPGPV